MMGSLDNPLGIKPVLEMFTKRRLDWAKALDVPQFTDMPTREWLHRPVSGMRTM
jgi:hypothetical protein